MKYLMIGGCADGEWHDTGGVPDWNVSKMPKPMYDQNKMQMREMTPYSRYRRVKFHAGGSETFVYMDTDKLKGADEDDVSELTLHALVAGYKREPISEHPYMMGPQGEKGPMGAPPELRMMGYDMGVEMRHGKRFTKNEIAALQELMDIPGFKRAMERDLGPDMMKWVLEEIENQTQRERKDRPPQPQQEPEIRDMLRYPEPPPPPYDYTKHDPSKKKGKGNGWKFR